METEVFDEIIDKLCKSSDSQLDATVFPALQRCKGNPPDRKQQLLDILDCCAYSSLASSFMMKMIHILYEESGGSLIERFNREKVFDNHDEVKQVFGRVFK